MLKISWSKLELFRECPRCFYFDIKFKIRRPSQYSLTFYNAMDMLMKSEMDFYRKIKGFPEIPSDIDCDYRLSIHPKIAEWRSKSQGLRLQWSDDITLLGLIDDLWEEKNGKFIVIDFKSTFSQKKVVKLPHWRDKMQRQLSFYSYLLMENGFDVHDKGVIFYVIGRSNKEGLFKKMEFNYNLFELPIDTGWIEKTVNEAVAMLQVQGIPKPSTKCPYCSFENKRNIL